MANGGGWDCAPQTATNFIHVIDYGQYEPFRYEPVQTWTVPYLQPTECSGDVHVFACSRCNTCKCGKATLSR